MTFPIKLRQSKKIVLVSEDTYSDTQNPGLKDEFRYTFGSWQKTQLGFLEYVENTESPFDIQTLTEARLSYNDGTTRQEDLEKSGVFDSKVNHLLVVPTIGEGTVTYPDQIYRQSYYAIVNKNNSPLEVEDIIKFDTRYSNLASIFYVPESKEDLENAVSSNNFKDENYIRSIDIVSEYVKQNVEYEARSELSLVKEEYALPNIYEISEDIIYKNFKGTTSEFLAKTIKNYTTSEIKRQNFKNIYASIENFEHIKETNNRLNTSIKQVNFNVPFSGDITKFKGLDGIPYYNKLLINNYSQTVYGIKKFLVDNFMFFLNRPDLVEFDMGTLLMRWHNEYKSILNESKKYYYSEEVKKSANEVIQDPSLLQEFIERSGDVVKVTEFREKQDLYSYDLIEWIYKYSPSILNNSDLNTFLIGPNVLTDTIADPKFETLMALGFAINKISDSLSKNTDVPDRVLPEGCYQEIYSKFFYDYKAILDTGGLGYSETLFFKIDKYIGDAFGEPIQSILIPFTVTNLDQAFEYIDTQVFYDRSYTYKVSEVKAVIGSEYEYKKVNQSFFGPDDTVDDIDPYVNPYVIQVNQFLKIKILEIPVFSKKCKIIAPPPMKPDFEIYPVRNDNNKIKIFFRQQYGEEKNDLIVLSSNDENIKQQIIQNQSTFRKANEIISNNISTVVKYDIFYSEDKPILKNDEISMFHNNLFYSITTDPTGDTNPYKQQAGASSAMATLNLIPNKKYYFRFLSRNRYGIASNPTKIYEVELVSDNGVSYPVVSEIFIDPSNYYEEFSKNSKSIHKFIRIRPNIAQSTLSVVGSNGIEKSKNLPISLGIQKDSIFPDAKPQNVSENSYPSGKRFKFRIKSKKTNQYFDFNLTFRHHRVRSIFDITTELSENTIFSPSSDNVVQPSFTENLEGLLGQLFSGQIVPSNPTRSKKDIAKEQYINNVNFYSNIQNEIRTEYAYPEIDDRFSYIDPETGRTINSSSDEIRFDLLLYK